MMTGNGRVLSEMGRQVGTHETKLNEGVGYDCCYLCTQGSSIYCSTRGDHVVCTEAECGCAQLWEDLEACGAQPCSVLELCDWCWNIGAMSLLALNLHPNVARIGTLH